MPLWSALYSFSYMADTVHLSWSGRLLRPNLINNMYLSAGVHVCVISGPGELSRSQHGACTHLLRILRKLLRNGRGPTWW